jgi:cytochrome c biogenesis protein CcdA/thiol-disulfide isomerase/thioredoxin
MFSKIKIFLTLIVISLALFSPSGVKAQDKADASLEKIKVVYFYSPDCPNCVKVKPFIEKVKNEYADKINFFDYNVKDKEEDRQLFFKFAEIYNISNAKIPLIFIGNDYLLGANDIKANLEAKIAEKITKGENIKLDPQAFLEEWIKTGGKVAIDPGQGSGSCGVGSTDDSCSIDGGTDNKQAISIGLIISMAAIDSLNPCAFAVLLFLIAVLISLKSEKKRIVAIGLVYILGIFLSYYFAGIGLLGVITQFNIAREINIFAAVIIIISAFISIKEGLFPDSVQLLKIPEKTKVIFASLMKKATFPAVFVSGILVSAFELPCTGQVYLGILSLMSQEHMKAQAYFYLFIYNLIFVLPLVLILLAAAWGLDMEKLQNFRKGTRKTIKILIGAIMFVLGIWLLYTTLY